MKKKPVDQGNTESPGTEPGDWDLWYDESCECDTLNSKGLVPLPLVGLEKYGIDRREWIEAHVSAQAALRDCPVGFSVARENSRSGKLIVIDRLRRMPLEDRLVLTLIRTEGAKALSAPVVVKRFGDAIEGNRPQFFEAVAEVLRSRRKGEDDSAIMRWDLVTHWTESPCFDWPPFCLWSLRALQKYCRLCYSRGTAKSVRNFFDGVSKPSRVLVKNVQISGKDWTLEFHGERRRNRVWGG